MNRFRRWLAVMPATTVGQYNVLVNVVIVGVLLAMFIVGLPATGQEDPMSNPEFVEALEVLETDPNNVEAQEVVATVIALSEEGPKPGMFQCKRFTDEE